MIWWIIYSIGIGLVLMLAIEHNEPGKYNNATLLVVVMLWPLLLAMLLFIPKGKVDRWRQ